MGPRDAYLPATGFDHEFPGQVRSRLWLQGADDNALVQRIAGYNLKGKVISDGLGLFSRMLEISPGKGNRPEGTGFEQVGGHTGQPAPFSHLPMVEDRQGKGLPLGVSPQISLKAKRINGRDESFDGVERGAWDGCILSHVPPVTEKERVSPLSYRDQKQRKNLAPNVPQHSYHQGKNNHNHAIVGRKGLGPSASFPVAVKGAVTSRQEWKH